MRSVQLILALSIAAPCSAQEWYDAADLMSSLRTGERRTVVAQAQLGDARELPLYEITVDVASDLRTFELEETAWITNRTGRALNDVVFRVHANAVVPRGEAPLVSLVATECLDGVTCTAVMSTPSTIVVQTRQPIAQNARVRVRFRLRGRMREIDASRTTMTGQGLEGLGAITGGHGDGDYGLLAHSAGVASMYGFFPILARTRGGRWEMSDQGTIGDLGTDELFHVRARVRLPDGVAIASSGVVASPRVAPNATEHVVSAGFVRDFALVAGARLRNRTRRAGDVTIRSWFVDGNEASGERVLDAAAQSLALFTRRFGAYPYTELDIAEAPLVGGAGGVEFSGFATVATMLYRPVDASQLPMGVAGPNAPDVDERRRAMLEFVTAHEVAHQWWHGLVGSDSRRHPFQDECLAQWSAMLYVEERYGRDRARREGDQQVAAGYHMMRLLGRPDAAVDQPAHAFADTVSYGGVVYGKGPFLYRELRGELGDRAFFDALRDYVREHRFRMAPPRALFERMARGRHTDTVNGLVRRWLEEAHGDDDLGQPDLGRMLGVGGSPNDPAMQMLQQLMGQLGGNQQGDVVRGLMELMQQGTP